MGGSLVWQVPPPPHNGFGEEEDSMGNCNRLVLRAPKKDITKWHKMDGQTLRFSAKLHRPPSSADSDRRYLSVCWPWLPGVRSALERLGGGGGAAKGCMAGTAVGKQEAAVAQPLELRLQSAGADDSCCRCWGDYFPNSACIARPLLGCVPEFA